jgi:serine/threonine-protein kinase
MRPYFVILGLAFNQLSNVAIAESENGIAVASSEVAESVPVVRHKATEAVGNGRYEEAIPAYRHIAQLDQSNPVAHSNLGLVLLATGHVDEGIAELKEAVKLAPNDPQFVIGLANQMVRAGRGDEALKFFEQAIELNTKNDNVHIGLASVYSEQHEYAKAIESYDAALAIAETPAARYGRIIALYSSGQFAQAVEDCDMVLQAHPSSHNAFALRAYANMRRGEYDAAERDAERSLEIGGPAAQLGYLALAGACLARHDSESAIRAIKKAIELAPSVPVHRIILAVACFKSANWDASIAALDSTIHTRGGAEKLNLELEGYGWQVYKLRGFINFRCKNDIQAGIKDLSQAILLNSHDADCYVLRGWAYTKLSDWESALADFHRALVVEPDHLVGNLFLARLLVVCPDKDIRNPAHALEIATRVCEQTNWTRPEFINFVAAAHSELGDYESAITTQKLVVERLRTVNRVNTYPLKMWWDFAPAFVFLGVDERAALDALKLYEQRKPYRSYSKQMSAIQDEADITVR